MKILLGVSGSISAYRALDIMRGLTKLGHDLSVVLTAGALKFVVPETFYYLGARNVFLPNSDFERERAGVLHIDLARDHDLFVIAPTSANMLSKLANGQIDDTLTALLLALRNDRDLLLFPSMNPDMWNSYAIKEAREKLAKRKNYHIFSPAKGEMACGEIGEGKLASVSAIVTAIDCWPFQQKRNSKNILITTGATLSPIDPVRFVTNPSSGKTGVELAKKFLASGANVTLIKGICDFGISDDLTIHPNYREINIKTTSELLSVVQTEIKTADAFISAGAPSDFESLEFSEHKIKKEESALSFTFKKAPDVLAWVSENYGQKVICVGFAAESNLSQEILEVKWKRKPTHYLIGTNVHGGFHQNEAKGFGADGAEYLIRTPQGEFIPMNISKSELAREIVKWVNT